MTAIALDCAPTRFRLNPVRGLGVGDVDTVARLISNFAVVTRGEALGHGLWLDAAFVEAVAEAGNVEARGLKSRFTHPGLSSDGTGKALGRVRRFNVDGDVARADLKFLRAASRSPDGDLAAYVLALAEEDPALFGASIVFRRDTAAELSFARHNVDEGGEFVSPDPLNVGNLPHARMGALLAVDVVDDPAANPGGFFDAAGDIATHASDALAYVLGLSDESPGADVFGGAHPDRARQFVARFLATRGLCLATKEAPKMTTQTTEPTAAEPVTPPAATLAELKAAFGNDAAFVLESLEKGRTADEAVTLWQERRIAQLEAENVDLAAQLEAAPQLPAAGSDPIPFGGSTDTGSAGDFMELARTIRDEANPDLTAGERRMGKGMNAAIKAAARKHPAAHAAYRKG